MKLVPHNKYVVCKQLTSDKTEVKGAFSYIKEDMPTYQILKSSIEDFKEGDVIICNATGTKVRVDDEYQWLFNSENIAGKVK